MLNSGRKCSGVGPRSSGEICAEEGDDGHKKNERRVQVCRRTTTALRKLNCEAIQQLTGSSVSVRRTLTH